MRRDIENIFSLVADNPLFTRLTQIDEAYLVGGAIRDYLLQRPISDYDFVIREKDFDKIKKIVLSLGLRHFTLNSGKLEFIRVIFDKYTFDFTKLIDTLDIDYNKRDFTINSIYINVKDKKVFANKRSFEDLENKLIRIVNESSISSDPVRIIRAIRFANELSFKIEKNTMQKILKNTSLISLSKKERVREEIKKILDSDIGSLFNILEGTFDIDFQESKRRFKMARNFNELNRNISQGITFLDLFVVCLISSKLPFFRYGFEGREEKFINKALQTYFDDDFEHRFNIFVSNREKLVPIMITLLKAPLEIAENYAEEFLNWSNIKIGGRELESFVKERKISRREARLILLKERCLKSEV